MWGLLLTRGGCNRAKWCKYGAKLKRSRPKRGKSKWHIIVFNEWHSINNFLSISKSGDKFVIKQWQRTFWNSDKKSNWPSSTPYCPPQPHAGRASLNSSMYSIAIFGVFVYYLIASLYFFLPIFFPGLPHYGRSHNDNERNIHWSIKSSLSNKVISHSSSALLSLMPTFCSRNHYFSQQLSNFIF